MGDTSASADEFGNSFSSSNDISNVVQSSAQNREDEQLSHAGAGPISVMDIPSADDGVKVEVPPIRLHGGRPAEAGLYANMSNQDLGQWLSDVKETYTRSYIHFANLIYSALGQTEKRMKESLATKSSSASPVRFLTKLDIETCLDGHRKVLLPQVFKESEARFEKVENMMRAMDAKIDRIDSVVKKSVGEGEVHVVDVDDRVVDATAVENDDAEDDKLKKIPPLKLKIPPLKPQKAIRTGTPVGKAVTETCTEKPVENTEGSANDTKRSNYKMKIQGQKRKKTSGDESSKLQVIEYSCILKKKEDKKGFRECKFKCNTIHQLSHHRQVVSHSYEHRTDGRPLPALGECDSKQTYACTSASLKGEPCYYKGLIHNLKRHLSTTVHVHDISFVGKICQLCNGQYCSRKELILHLRGPCGAKKLRTATYAALQVKKRVRSTSSRTDDDGDEEVSPPKKKVKRSVDIPSPSPSASSSPAECSVSDTEEESCSVIDDDASVGKDENPQCPSCSLSFKSFPEMVKHLQRCPVYNRR